MKSKVDKLYVDKLVPVTADLKKINWCSTWKKLLKKQCVINWLKTINTSNLVKKTDYNTKINELEKKTIDHDHSNE